jgi:O-antigen/teichoic acid export membrane protein
MMLISLNTNLPRYFIERYAGPRALGFFAAIAYLMVAGALVTNALGQAAVARLAGYYAAAKTQAFRALLLRLCGIAGIQGAAGALIAAVAGKHILRLLYQSDYAAYSNVFFYLMIAAGIGYMASIMGYGMTAARLFNPQVLLFSIVLALSALACFLWVPLYGLRGAAFALILAAGIQLLGSVAVLMGAFRAGSRQLNCQL